MGNFKTCSNGHNYDSSKSVNCPYCPGNNTESNYEKTLSDFNKTQSLDDGNSSQFAKTMINEETMDFRTTAPGKGAENHCVSLVSALCKRFYRISS